MFLFSGEFHPFRLPSPGLWLDIFQKIKALGFNTVSFYLDWGLLEGNQGHIVTDGIFSLEPFFEAATEAGIYLIARPGPYINAETNAGGFPGWVLRIQSVLRSYSADYLNATENYISTISQAIAKAQITNEGPVILVQPENEYTTWPNVTGFPDQMNREYMAYVEQQYLSAGITVPLIVNDNEVQGYWAPGSGLGAVDVYGIDAYPLRYDCKKRSLKILAV
jgi:beta-galactosidase GanA